MRTRRCGRACADLSRYHPGPATGALHPMPEPQSKPQRERRPKTVPRKMSRERLANIARYHLERFSTTAAHLRQVLMRRTDRAIRAHGGDRMEMAGWIDELIARLLASGALDDARYAAAKAADL